MSAITINQSRLKYLHGIGLDTGLHEEEEDRYCLLEACAWVAGESLTDHPLCVCPVIANFLREWNDALEPEERTRLLLPLIPGLIGTRAGNGIECADNEHRRSKLAAQWLVREFAPAWLRAAGHGRWADMMAVMESPDIDVIELIGDAARVGDPTLGRLMSCGINIWMPSRAVARAGASAFAAVLPSSWLIPANIASGRIATVAAAKIMRNGGLASATPTVQQLQASAVDLVHRMIEVGGRRA